MEISYATSKLQKLFNNDSKMRGQLGPECAEKLQRQLTALTAAECLEDVRHLPQMRCHELTGDRKGQLAVDLEHPKRLIFVPDHEPIPTLPNGGMDWRLIVKIQVVEIVDYHKS